MRTFEEKVLKPFATELEKSQHISPPINEYIPVPVHINLELTTACNYSCQYCAVSIPSYRASKINKQEAFKIIDDLALMEFSAGTVQLSGHGESTILPWFEELIIYIREKLPSISICFHTNGSYLDKHAKTIVEQKVNHVSISVDGGSLEVFEQIRGKGSFEKLINGLTMLNHYKVEQNINEPFVCFVATLMKTNIFELDKLIELAHRFNVNQVITQPLTPYLELGTQVVTLNSLVQQERAKAYEVVSKAKKLAESNGIELKILNEDPFNEPVTEWHLAIEKNQTNDTTDNQPSINETENIATSTTETESDNSEKVANAQENSTNSNISQKQYRLCTDPWRMMYINAKGGFDTCCFRHNDISETLANYSLNDVWYHSAGLNKVRNDLLQGTLDKICTACTVRPISEHPPVIPEKWTG
jgi:MoaA/NifB/PqqE/SkfB family radical SAM enzyme